MSKALGAVPHAIDYIAFVSGRGGRADSYHWPRSSTVLSVIVDRHSERQKELLAAPIERALLVLSNNRRSARPGHVPSGRD